LNWDGQRDSPDDIALGDFFLDDDRGDDGEGGEAIGENEVHPIEVEARSYVAKHHWAAGMSCKRAGKGDEHRLIESPAVSVWWRPEMAVINGNLKSAWGSSDQANESDGKVNIPIETSRSRADNGEKEGTKVSTW
jgi:hypothetical protein